MGKDIRLVGDLLLASHVAFPRPTGLGEGQAVIFGKYWCRISTTMYWSVSFLLWGKSSISTRNFHLFEETGLFLSC